MAGGLVEKKRGGGLVPDASLRKVTAVCRADDVAFAGGRLSAAECDR